MLKHAGRANISSQPPPALPKGFTAARALAGSDLKLSLVPEARGSETPTILSGGFVL